MEDSKSYFAGGRGKGGEEFVYEEAAAWVEAAQVCVCVCVCVCV